MHDDETRHVAPSDRIRIGVQLSTWGPDRLGRDFTGVLDEVGQTGCQGVEIGVRYLDLAHPEALRPLLERNRLHLIACMKLMYLYDTGLLPTYVEELKQAATFALALGADFLTIATIRKKDGRPTKEDVDTALRVLEATGRACHDEGIPLLYHNYATAAQTGEIERICAETDPAVMNIALDIGWFTKGGGDFFAFYQRWHEQVKYVHFKDHRGYQSAYPIGQGNVGYERVLATLLAAGYTGWGTIELEQLPGTRESWEAMDEDITHRPYPDPLRGVSESVRWLNQTLAKLENRS
ncbi:MAG: sugar phosphate isomerase/epimerase [Dehalococcoidales bacterium]|nr:sugar phosphate isomerase/epimerase [Dehalococcoidales bacterium]